MSQAVIQGFGRKLRVKSRPLLHNVHLIFRNKLLGTIYFNINGKYKYLFGVGFLNPRTTMT